ncbi:MAG: hypothetical protein U1E54_00500 [Candidatus Levybacteria bacterium]|nr:hypothetical protein [Candidatus Levybacteria bacterium]
MLLKKSEQLNLTLAERIKYMEREIALERRDIRTTLERNIQAADKENERYGGIATQPKLRARMEAEAAQQEGTLNETNKILKETLNTQKTTSQKAERLGENFSRMLPGMLSADTAGGMVTSGTGALLGATIFGALAAVVVAKGIKGAMAMEPSMVDYAILKGKTMLETIPDVAGTKGMDLGKSGLLPSKYFANYSQLFRAGGGRVNENMLGVMQGEMALGLNRQTTAGLMNVERYGAGQVTPIMRFFENYLRQTSQSIAVLPEVLGTFTTEAGAVLKSMGKVDSGAIAASISAIGKGFGLTGAPLQDVYSAMRQGLQQSSNPAIQAMQFSAMERAMPGASLWEMQKAMENPMQNPKYVTNMLAMLKKTAVGGQEGYARNIMNVLGVSANIADVLASGELTPEMWSKKGFGKVGGYKTRAEDIQGRLAQATAEIQGGFEREGFEKTEPAVQELRDILNGIGGLITATQENQAEVIKLQNDMLSESIKATGWLKKIALSNVGTVPGP